MPALIAGKPAERFSVYFRPAQHGDSEWAAAAVTLPDLSDPARLVQAMTGAGELIGHHWAGATFSCGYSRVG
jgi:hypothetical protein